MSVEPSTSSSSSLSSSLSSESDSLSESVATLFWGAAVLEVMRVMVRVAADVTVTDAVPDTEAVENELAAADEDEDEAL